MFGDDKRFQRPMAPISDKRIMADIMRPETPSHIGPGTYFSLNSEDQRNGWAHKSFSRRQPMDPPPPSLIVEMPVESASLNRSDYYKSGTISSNGLMTSPKADYFKQSPGPGQYNVDMCTTSFPPSPSKSQGLTRVGTAELLLKKTSSMGSSPKFAYITPHNQLKNEVLFTSNERNYSNIGPGHYLIPSNHIIKKSHNIRTISNSKVTSNQSNYNKSSSDKSKYEKHSGVQKIVDIRLNLGAPGSSFRIPEIDRPKTSAGVSNNYSSVSTSPNNNSKHKHAVIDLDDLQK